MSANIDGASLMYVGAKPWHGIGTELKSLATSAEAIKAAGLDWSVNLAPVFAAVPNSDKFMRVDNKFATMRSDRQEALGVVGKNYTPVQNSDAFGFFDSVVGAGQAMYEVCGSLGRGEQIWMLAKLPTDIVVGRDDVVNKYLLLVNSHDGLSCLKMFFTPVRVVCQNTLSSSLSQRKAGEGLNIRHHANIADKIRVAQDVLGIANRKFDELGQSFQHLSAVKINTQWLEDYVKLCFPVADESKISAISVNTRKRVMELVDSPTNRVAGASGTAWGAYNAVTEYIDHKTTRGTDAARLKSNWMGNGAVIKERALQIALQVAA